MPDHIVKAYDKELESWAGKLQKWAASPKKCFPMPWMH